MKNLIKPGEKVLFIEGNKVYLESHCIRIKEELEEYGAEVHTLMDVYNNISKLDMIRELDIQHIIIQTVGGSSGGMFDYAIQYFLEKEFKPKNLILVYKDSKIYFKDVYNKIPLDIYYIDPFNFKCRSMNGILR